MSNTLVRKSKAEQFRENERFAAHFLFLTVGGGTMERKKSSFFRSLLFLLTPEDSGGHCADADRAALTGICPLALFDRPDYLGKIKAALWVIASVLISAAIAQLG